MIPLIILCLGCFCSEKQHGFQHSEPEESVGDPRVEHSHQSFVDVSIGYRTACGVRTDGRLQCWGESTDAPPGAKWRRVEQKEDLSCALDVGGLVCCWGTPEYTVSCSERGTMYPEGPWVDLTVDYGNACGLSADGQVACWGSAAGVGTFMTEQGDSPVVDITSRVGRLVALHANKSISYWDLRAEQNPPIQRLVSQADLELNDEQMMLIGHGQGVVVRSTGSVLAVMREGDDERDVYSYELWSAGTGVVQLVTDDRGFCARYDDGHVACDSGTDDTGANILRYGGDPPADARFSDIALWYPTSYPTTGCGVLADSGQIACWSQEPTPPPYPMFTDLP